MKKIDLTGNVLGTLKVLSEDEERNEAERDRARRGEIVHAKLYWICECSECGSVASYCGDNLRSGNTTTCWNCRSIKISNAVKKENNITVCDDRVEVEAANTHNIFTFDLSDIDILSKHCWHETGYGYLASRIRGYGIVFAHRLLMLGLDKIKEDVVIDHINGDRKDCRRKNMRICTVTENNMNRRRVRSRSGVIGVYSIDGSDKWRASICVNHKQISLGIFDSFEEAKKARVEAELKYFGEFSPYYMLSQA